MSKPAPLSAIRPYQLSGLGSSVETTIPMARFARLGSLIAGVPEDEAGVEVALNFSRGPRRTCMFTGRVSVVVLIDCQRCLEQRPARIECLPNVRFVMTEERAEELAALPQPADAADIIVVEQEVVDVVELVEDDLLLALPQICQDLEQCVIPLPAAMQENVTLAESSARPKVATKRPFSGLDEMLKAHRSE